MFDIIKPLAGVAQLVEQLICNQPAVRSSRITSFLNKLMVLQSL
ncbi:hypothetical protein S7335_3208 [Synechococcus sp. PCC 7335]|nr:hypothetical protein S7335_3208 [Synechococcus sp. PCC 7335]